MKKIILILIFILITMNVYSAGIGIIGFPSSIEILEGQETQTKFYISSSFGDAKRINISAIGDNPEWFSFNINDFILEAGKAEEILIKINPDNTLYDEEYSYEILITPGSTTSAESKLGSSISVRASNKLKLIVSKDITIDIIGKSFSISNSEEGVNNILTSKIKNESNVSVEATANLKYFKDGQLVFEESVKLDKIYPNDQKDITTELNTKDLKAGDYKAEISILHKGTEYAKKETNFKIEPKGTFSLKLKLLEINQANNVRVGKPAELTSRVQNLSSIPMFARLNAKMYINGELVDVIASNPIKMLPEEIGYLEMIYIPKTAGQLESNIWVEYYSNDSSFVKKTDLEKLKSDILDESGNIVSNVVGVEKIDSTTVLSKKEETANLSGNGLDLNIIIILLVLLVVGGFVLFNVFMSKKTEKKETHYKKILHKTHKKKKKTTKSVKKKTKKVKKTKRVKKK